MYAPILPPKSHEEGEFHLLSSRISELEAHMSEAASAISTLERIIQEKDRRISYLEEQLSNRRSIDATKQVSICSTIPFNYSNAAYPSSKYKLQPNRSLYEIKKHEKALEE